MTNDLPKIYRTLKSLLKKYEPPFTARRDMGHRYELWSEKEVLIAGRKKPAVFFASLIIQRNYVGFYFMPVYNRPEMIKKFKKELLATLKGKSCFHIKKLDSVLKAQIEKALQAGHKLYQKNDWI